MIGEINNKIINMANQGKTLERLKEEANYEDNIAKNILDYCQMSKYEITDIPDDIKNEIIQSLSKIRSDSERHEMMIRKLIDLVLNQGEKEY
jgi:hypothetical protein